MSRYAVGVEFKVGAYYGIGRFRVSRILNLNLFFIGMKL